jgi:hypothetical protein
MTRPLAAWALFALGVAPACGDSDVAPPAASTPTTASAPTASASASAEPPPPSRAVEPSHRTVALRPDVTSEARCGTRAPVCVHAGAGVADRAVIAALDAAERAFATLDALKLPRPPYDGSLGGDARLDVYLDPEAREARVFCDVGGAVPGVDRTSAFVVAPPPLVGCGQLQRIASSVVGAMLLGEDAAISPGVRTMMSDRIAMLATPCSVEELEQVDTAQRAPDRGIIGSDGEATPGSFLLPWFLEERYGTDEPGKLSVALVAISQQRTPFGKSLVDEPDVFDALRVTQHARGTSLSDTMLDFAVDRAFMGSRSDGAHLADVARFGEMGRPRFEWSVAHASLPRRLAPARAVEPLGATYVWVDLSKPQLPTELTMVVEWEEPVAFRWAVIELDAQGGETSRTELTPVLGETRMEKSFRDLHGSASVLIVGVNEGEARRDEPIDPDIVREPAHGYTLSLYP